MKTCENCNSNYIELVEFYYDGETKVNVYECQNCGEREYE